MRNSTSANSTNTVQDAESNSINAERASAKKLRQARLPFKVIDPGTSPIGSKTFISPAASDKDKDAIKDINTLESRKRKLSYDAEDDGGNNDLNNGDNTSKENVEILAAAAKKKKLSAISSNDVTSEVISLLNEDDEGCKDASIPSVEGTANKKELSTSKSAAKDNKRKGAGTPKATSAQKEKNASSATKLQIKLPLSSGKKKRRKTSLSQEKVKSIESEKSSQELSSEEIEVIATELNPLKRTKSNEADIKATEIIKCIVEDQKKEIEIVALDSESEADEKHIKGEISQPKTALSAKVNRKTKTGKNVEKPEQLKLKFFRKSSTEKSLSNSKKETVLAKTSDHDHIEISDTSDGSEEELDVKEELDENVLSDNDNEADDETENLAGKPPSVSSDVGENSKSKPESDALTPKAEKSAGTSTKVLTPKQIKLMEQRRKAREEKERKLQEEKLKKQQEKEEKELVRKREREEKEEQKRKEREEKEEQKRKERGEKERKRLAEVVAKNEEKRKKIEAKEEELRKKDEERKRKEQEKEEAELKKKKAAQAFTKFFVAKTPNNNQIKNEDDSNTGDSTKILAFRPFQIKGDMKLAPIIRKTLTPEAKDSLDDLLGRKSKVNKSQLYLSELRSGLILPGRWRRPSTESKDDVILVEDELERVGLEIAEVIPADVREEMRVKFYKFHDNRRPPYYGTWRKKSSFIKPRKPFAQDKKFFDYEIDSDDEWEEEEPGESLEDGSDEDKEKESEDDDYEVDNEWFVPHGHLSDEELQNEDEIGLGDDNTREAQKVKLQLLQQEFAQEMKKKTEKIKPRLIGCIWADINGNQPPECAKILWDTLEKKAMIFDEPPLVEEPEVDRPSENNSPSALSNGNGEKAADKLKPIGLSDNMIKDLTRLVHGNNHSKNFLINEYIAYVEKTEKSIKNGDLRKPLKSVVRDKIDEIAEWQAVDANASSIKEMEQANDESNDKKKKKVKRRLCWVVKQEMLDKMDLSSLQLQNSWQYTLTPKFVKPDKKAKTNETTATSLTGECNKKTSTEYGAEKNGSTPKGKSTNKPQQSTPSNETSSNRAKLNASISPKAKKRVPLLMSVPRGEKFSTPAKNKLISQFLQQKDKKCVEPTTSPTAPKLRSNTNSTSPNIVDDDLVILD